MEEEIAEKLKKQYEEQFQKQLEAAHEKEIEELERNFHTRETQNKELEDRITRLNPMIQEANITAEKLKKEVQFEAELVSIIPD
jgi:predicted  nucleic acid-binding Zn-ribbon protein